MKIELEELEVGLVEARAELRIMLKWLRLLRPSEAEWSAWVLVDAERDRTWTKVDNLEAQIRELKELDDAEE